MHAIAIHNSRVIMPTLCLEYISIVAMIKNCLEYNSRAIIYCHWDKHWYDQTF